MSDKNKENNIVNMEYIYDFLQSAANNPECSLTQKVNATLAGFLHCMKTKLHEVARKDDTGKPLLTQRDQALLIIYSLKDAAYEWAIKVEEADKQESVTKEGH